MAIAAQELDEKWQLQSHFHLWTFPAAADLRLEGMVRLFVEGTVRLFVEVMVHLLAVHSLLPQMVHRVVVLLPFSLVLF